VSGSLFDEDRDTQQIAAVNPRDRGGACNARDCRKRCGLSFRWRGLCGRGVEVGRPDQFSDNGNPARLLSLQGLDAAGIERSIRARFAPLLGAPVVWLEAG